jgi:hydrogenase maturation protease
MKQPSPKPRRRKKKKPRILIAGLGNLLLRDDGVGVHAVRRFQQKAAESYKAAEVGCAVFDALPLFEWADKILLIDAMIAGSSPGTVYRLEAVEDLDDGAVPNSLHELSIVQVLRMIRKPPMPEATIIGIEPEVIEFGMELSPAVAAALDQVIETGEKIIQEWSSLFNGSIREGMENV